MKKILLGFLGIALIATVVGSSAYALFSSQATITGVTLTSGNAELMLGNGNSDHATTISGSALNPFLSNVYPGFTFNNLLAPTHMYNNSSASIKLAVKGQITSWSSTQGDWSALAANVSARVCKVVENANPALNAVSDCGNWYTLQQWHDYAIDLPGAPIDPSNGTPWSGKAAYALYFSVSPDAGNEIANSDLSNMTITFTGTQAN